MPLRLRCRAKSNKVSNLRYSVLLMSLLASACASVDRVGGSNDLITGDDLRAMVVGKIVTFPEGRSVTGIRCYIFEEGGRALICSGRDVVDYGRFVISNDRVCTDLNESLCWQFYRNRAASYFIRHLAIVPEPKEEPVCIETWKREPEPCRLPLISQ